MLRLLFVNTAQGQAMKNKTSESKIFIAAPLILGALSLFAFTLYFYSANHAPYTYTDVIIAGPILSFIGVIISFITRESRKAYPTLWICGLFACSFGFIICVMVILILIVFVAARISEA